MVSPAVSWRYFPWNGTFTSEVHCAQNLVKESFMHYVLKGIHVCVTSIMMFMFKEFVFQYVLLFIAHIHVYLH